MDIKRHQEHLVIILFIILPLSKSFYYYYILLNIVMDFITIIKYHQFSILCCFSKDRSTAQLNAFGFTIDATQANPEVRQIITPTVNEFGWSKI